MNKSKPISIRELGVTAVKGGLIGIANIIPGVSGGTFALILGLFDKLVNALNAIDMAFFKATISLVFGFWRKPVRKHFVVQFMRIDGLFLIALMCGAAISALALAFAMEYLLTKQTTFILAFFVGLIVPSIAVPFAMMEKRGWRLLLIVPGVLLTVGVAMVMPDNGRGLDNPFIAAGAGAVAISAMILPGISGSFVLLIMGQYQNFIAKVTGLLFGLSNGAFDIGAFVWLVAFAVGLVVGLLAFSRLLAWLLKKAKSGTMAFLVGLIVGSLFVLWPFKNLDGGALVVGRDGEVKQDVQIATAANRLPEDAAEAGWAAVALLAGFAGAFAMGRLGKEDSA